jgi:hypothetical protein
MMLVTSLIISHLLVIELAVPDGDTHKGYD